MSNYNSLKAAIDANIKQNGRQEITGQVLNSVLNQMVTALGAGYQFMGVATPDTNPGTPDAKVFYIANGKGTYTNFGSLEVTEDEVVVLYWDSSWHKVSTGIASQAKLTELNNAIGLGQELYEYENVRYIEVTPKNVPLNKGYKLTLTVSVNNLGSNLLLRGYKTNTVGDTDTLLTFTQGTTGTKSVILARDYIKADIYASSGTWSGSFTIDSYNASILKELSDLSISLEDVQKVKMLYVNANKSLLKNGNLNDAEGYYTSDFIPIDNIKEFKILGVTETYTTKLCYYDENYVFISAYTNISTNNIIETIKETDYPTGAKYVRVSNGDSNNYGVWGLVSIGSLYNSTPSEFEIAKQLQGDSAKLYYINDNIHNNGFISHEGGYYATDYLSLDGVTKFWWKGNNGSSAIGLAFYGESKNFLGYYGSLSTAYEKEIKASEFPTGAKYIRATNTGYVSDAYYLYGIPLIAETFTYAKKAYDALPTEGSIIVSSFSKVYGVAPSSTYGRDYAIKMYLEGLIRNRVNITLSGGLRSKIIQSKVALPSSGGILSTNHIFNIGNVSKNIALVRSSNTRGQNKLMKVLGIGDSTLDMDLANAEGVKSGGWNYISCVKEMIEKDNKDIGNISATMIGTRNNQSGRTISYGGETITIRAFSEGRAGWTCYGYLNFPCPVKMGVAYEANARLNSTAAWYALGLATRTPFDSSTTGQTWESYADTDAQKLLIATTPFGRYKTDMGSTSEQYTECADLWQRVNYLSGVWSPGTYTGTAEQKAFIENYFANVMTNPNNPFYSKTKAQAYTGSHSWTYNNAFSLTEYLSRYRTMDDLGVRLSGSAGESVTGSDGETYVVGTKVTNVNDYDVCMPNYVFVGTGINDVDSSVAIAKETISNLIDCICDEDENIKVAWGIPRSPFVFDNCYSNVNAFEASSGGGRFDINEEMIAELSDTTQDSRKFFLPIYNTMSVVGGNGCVASEELDSGEKVISAGSDNVHPSLYQSKTIAYQIYSWLYYIN